MGSIKSATLHNNPDFVQAIPQCLGSKKDSTGKVNHSEKDVVNKL